MKRKGLKLFTWLAITLAVMVVAVINMRAENVSADDGFTYSDKGSYVVITKYSGSVSSVTIPSSHDSKPVTKIGDRAFYNNTTIKSVTIPETVTEIGSGAFMKCTNLTDITVPDSVLVIGEAFGWSGVRNVYIGKNVKRLSNKVFASCSNLSRVIVANPDIIWSNVDLSGTPKFTICAPSGSTSQTFASNNGLRFENYSGGSSGGGSSSGCSHDWTRDDSDSRNSDSTCTEYGNIVQKCRKCGETRVVKRTTLKDHQLGGWETIKLATSSSNGEAVRKCLDCGKIIERKELYFNGGEGEVVTEAPPNNNGGSSGGSGGNSGSSSGSSGNSGSGGSGSSGGSSGNSGSNSGSGNGGSGSPDNSGNSGSGGSSGTPGNNGGSDNNGGNTGADNIDYGNGSSAEYVNKELADLDPDKVLKPRRQVTVVPIFIGIGGVVIIVGAAAFVINKRR